MSCTVFPRIYTNLQSKVCFQVWRPVISAIENLFMSFYEKSLHFFYFWKNSPKSRQIFQLFTLYSKGRHFGITKLDILIFCNILPWNAFLKFELKKDSFFIKFCIKSCEKYYKWDIEKNGIAYSMARNLKTAYLWNFHSH